MEEEGSRKRRRHSKHKHRHRHEHRHRHRHGDGDGNSVGNGNDYRKPRHSSSLSWRKNTSEPVKNRNETGKLEGPLDEDNQRSGPVAGEVRYQQQIDSHIAESPRKPNPSASLSWQANVVKDTNQVEEVSVLPEEPAPAPDKPDKDVMVPTNYTMAEMLKARLKGSNASISPSVNKQQTKQVESTMLPSVNRDGTLIRSKHPVQQHNTENFESHDKDGKRTAYFRDDQVGLKTLVQEQKYGAAQNVDDLLAGSIAGKRKFKEGDLGVENEYDNDAALELIGNTRARKGNARHDPGAFERKERQRQINAYERMNKAQMRCPYCIANPRRPKELMVAIGQMAYLMLPMRNRITKGHCLIVPIEHISSTRVADDNTNIEIRNFKKSLIHKFAAEGKSVIFMELAKDLNRERSHAIIEAIPIPSIDMEQAPIFFKQAFDEISSDWDQHHSKRLIETGPRGLNEKIPANFPYFFVEFGLKRGFVHVIDNEDKFKSNFGVNIVSSLLSTGELDTSDEEKWAPQFKEEFKAFDWTSQLL